MMHDETGRDAQLRQQILAGLIGAGVELAPAEEITRLAIDASDKALDQVAHAIEHLEGMDWVHAMQVALQLIAASALAKNRFITERTTAAGSEVKYVLVDTRDAGTVQ